MWSESEGLESLRVTGVMVSYYFVCRTKLWLFAHHISLEREDENVKIGNAVHQESYKREKREVELPGMKMDFIRKGDVLEIHEVKKSRKMEDADRYQVLYYLYELKKRGVNARGVINYPLARRTLDVVLTGEESKKMEEIISDIKSVVGGDFVPPIRKRICGKCAYYEFCFGGSV